MDVRDHVAQIMQDGYTVIEGLHDEATRAEWRDLHERMRNSVRSGDAQYLVHRKERNTEWWYSGCVEYDPEQMLHWVNNPTVLDIVERVIGPFAQLDNTTFAAYEPLDPSTATEVSLWHRDRRGGFPRGTHAPVAQSSNAISYLQDLDDQYGPLRVIPGSHINPVAISDDDKTKRHSDEKLLYMKAGDVVVTHSALLHSGTPNVSGKPRYFMSALYCKIGARTNDDYSGPNCQQVIADARRRDDRRLLRLFGVDDHFEERVNYGYRTPEEPMWEQWIAEDRAALEAAKATAPSR